MRTQRRIIQARLVAGDPVPVPPKLLHDIRHLVLRQAFRLDRRKADSA
jgi:hypothetical protein